MTIFEAPEYDPRKARRRNIIILVSVVVVVVLGIFLFIFRNWPEEHAAQKFFTALQNKDFKMAYGIWIADPTWENKPPLARYTYDDFYRDWGPSGEWGPISSFKIDGATHPTGSNGVIVVVTINNRKESTNVFVDKKDHSISFSPFEVVQ
jgi:hypothetical protein